MSCLVLPLRSAATSRISPLRENGAIHRAHFRSPSCRGEPPGYRTVDRHVARRLDRRRTLPWLSPTTPAQRAPPCTELSRSRAPHALTISSRVRTSPGLSSCHRYEPTQTCPSPVHES